MDMDLSGRRALVTGSTGGIGLAVATGLAGQGAAVVLNGRTPDRVSQAAATVREAVPGAEVLEAPGDVGTADGVAAVLAAAGRVDVLVNNTGVFAPVPFAEIDDDAWQQVWATNVMSGVRLSRALAPGMAERGWGRIVFVSSESALQIPPEMVHYGVTKTAQLGLSRGIAESYPGTGLTVNAVLPGPTTSEGFTAMLADEAERQGVSVAEAGRRFVAGNRPSSLLGRPTSPEEVANLVVYLCTPAASGTTGAALRVDGGVVRSAA